MTSFYTEEELKKIGFKSVGTNVLISRKTSLYGVSRISISNNVRIDDYCVLSAGSGGIEIGNYVHLAIFVSLQGDGKITLEEFSGISSRTAVYTSNDDYFGNYMTNPTVPSEFTNVTSAPVTLRKHALVGSGCVILPGVTLNVGCAVGALSLVNRDCEEFMIYSGNPAKPLIKRSRNLLEQEKRLIAKINSDNSGVRK